MNLRSGQFTPEETEYCNAVINYFKRGYLDAQNGQPLTGYLAKKLNCGIVRVSKRFPSAVNYHFPATKIQGCDDVVKPSNEIIHARVRL